MDEKPKFPRMTLIKIAVWLLVMIVAASLALNIIGFYLQ